MVEALNSENTAIPSRFTVISSAQSIVGLALIFACEASLLLSERSRMLSSNESIGTMFPLLCFFITLALVYICMRKENNLLRHKLMADKERALPKGNRVFLMVGGVAASLALCGAFHGRTLCFHLQIAISPEAWLIIEGILTALAGLFMGILQFSWYGFIGRRLPARASQAFAISVMVGLCLALLCLWLSPVIAEMVPLLFPAIAGCLFFFSARTSIFAANRDAPNTTTQEHHLDMAAHAILFSYQFIFGFIICVAVDALEVGWISLALIAAIAVAGFFAFARTRPNSTIGNMGRVFLPICVALAFCIVSDKPVALIIAPIIAFAACIFQSLSNVMFLMDMACSFRIDMISHVATGRTPPMLGFACGLLIGIVYRLIGYIEPWHFLVPCIITMGCIFCYANIPFNRGNPMKDGVMVALEDGIQPWVADNEATERALKAKCDSLAQKNNLSPRESEILFYLGCGYNMISISELLCISTSTVKTHTYHVYQKLGVHSQQDIIMMLRPHDE